MFRILVTFLILFASSFSQAKIFKNSYISFELPLNWSCHLESTEWVCVNDFEDKIKEAIIILTAKEKGVSDNLDQYRSYLNQPKSWEDDNGHTMTSEVVNITDRSINEHTWVDGHHFQSEVRQYYTRYLGTVKGRVAILVTFSAHKDHYTTFVNDFLQAIQSLKVNPKYLDKDSSKGLVKKKKKSLFDKNEGLEGEYGDNETTSNPIVQWINKIGQEKFMGGLLILISLIGLLLFLRKRDQ